MSVVAEEIQYARQAVDRLDPFSDGADEVRTVLLTLVGALERVYSNVQERGAEVASAALPAISRVEALKAAREHVEAMSTNSRGYQDGVKLADKVAAMETFARFLMGETP
jgi:membrane protein required for beta-lactamase induction